MKVHIKILSGREVLLEGELSEPEALTRRAIPGTSVQRLEAVGFAIERAINSSEATMAYRAHVSLVEDSE